MGVAVNDELDQLTVREIERALAPAWRRRGPFELWDRELHVWVDAMAAIEHAVINGLREWRRLWLDALDER